MVEEKRKRNRRGSYARSTFAERSTNGAWEPGESVWRQDAIWPDDSPGYIFLGRAITVFAESLFGDQWLGSEQTAKPLPILPGENSSNEISQDIYAASLIRKFDPETWEQIGGNVLDLKLLLYLTDNGDVEPNLGLFPEFSWDPSDAVWSSAASIALDLSKSASAAITRWVKLKKDFTNALISGSVESFVRPVIGGSLTEIPPDLWRSERIFDRFDSCTISLDDPFSLHSSKHDDGYIFIGAVGLQGLPSFRYRSLLTESFYNRLSPYMRLALSVADELELSPSNQPPLKIVIDRLSERWHETGAAASAILIGKMATMLRERGHGKAEGK